MPSAADMIDAHNAAQTDTSRDADNQPKDAQRGDDLKGCWDMKRRLLWEQTAAYKASLVAIAAKLAAAKLPARGSAARVGGRRVRGSAARGGDRRVRPTAAHGIALDDKDDGTFYQNIVPVDPVENPAHKTPVERIPITIGDSDWGDSDWSDSGESDLGDDSPVVAAVVAAPVAAAPAAAVAVVANVVAAATAALVRRAAAAASAAAVASILRWGDMESSSDEYEKDYSWDTEEEESEEESSTPAIELAQAEVRSWNLGCNFSFDPYDLTGDTSEEEESSTPAIELACAALKQLSPTPMEAQGMVVEQEKAAETRRFTQVGTATPQGGVSSRLTPDELQQHASAERKRLDSPFGFFQNKLPKPPGVKWGHVMEFSLDGTRVAFMYNQNKKYGNQLIIFAVPSVIKKLFETLFPEKQDFPDDESILAPFGVDNKFHERFATRFVRKPPSKRRGNRKVAN